LANSLFRHNRRIHKELKIEKKRLRQLATVSAPHNTVRAIHRS
jgi:hypothetical protein